MNLYLRIFWVWLIHFFRPKLPLLGESLLHFVVFPGDLDIFGHVNNGRYQTIMDLGRMDLLLRTPLGKIASAHGWNPIVRAVHMDYRKSLKLGQRYLLRSRIAGWDAQWFYLEQIFEINGLVAAVGKVKGVLVGASGKIPTQKVLATAEMDQPSPLLKDEFLKVFHPHA